VRQKTRKEREKQFDKVLTNAVNLYGSLKGIAGGSIPHIRFDAFALSMYRRGNYYNIRGGLL